MMMEAYFDESGIHGEAKVCVVAGYYGSQASWRRFESQWNKVLSCYPEVEAEGFHAKVFFGEKDGARSGPYKGWSDEKARKFIERLLQTITRNRIFPIGYGVIVDDFLDLPKHIRLWLTGAKFSPKSGKWISGGCPSRSYYLPFQFCVLKSVEKSRANPIDKIHFFAGLDRTFSEYANELYKFLHEDDRLPKETRDKLGQISYPLSKDTPGIQAADLFSNRLYRRALYAIKNPDSNPTELLEILMKNWQGTPELKLMNKTVFSDMERRARESLERMRHNTIRNIGKNGDRRD